jgi:pimeloyl-ACP methyl ester carboxylesterase
VTAALSNGTGAVRVPAIPQAVVETLKIALPLVLVAGGLLYIFQEAFIFFPQGLPPGRRESLAAHEVIFEREGVRLHGWWLKGAVSAARPLVIYHGGNAEEVSGSLEDRRRMPIGAFLAVNYRGYGASQGKPSEAALAEDALFVFDQVTAAGIPPEHVVLMGRSLGSGVAVHVASRRNVRGVILVTPFDRLVNVARRHYPFLPVGLLLRHRFDSLDRAPAITAPLLALMGSADDIIPNPLTRNLVAAWGGPSRLVTVPGAGHNDIHLDERYWSAIGEFFRTLDADPAPRPVAIPPAVR